MAALAMSTLDGPPARATCLSVRSPAWSNKDDRRQETRSKALCIQVEVLAERLVKGITIRLQRGPAFASRRCCNARSAGRRAPLAVCAGSAGMAAWVLDKHSNKTTKLTDEYKLGKVTSRAF